MTRLRVLGKSLEDFAAEDANCNISRWLVHSIADYYGLSSRSITVGDPARREAYVGIREVKSGRSPTASHAELPRPLWAMI